MSAINATVRREMLDDQVRAAGPKAWKLYQQILKGGETAEWAAMCALRQAPGSKGTDRAFQQGARRQMDGMSPVVRRKVLAAAKAAGINTDGKFFKGSLGKASDPAAWVSTADDVLAVARAKNLTLSGVVEHKGVEYQGPAKRVRLAPDLIDQMEKSYIAEDPALGEKIRKNPKKRRELREKIVHKHGSKAK